MDLDLYFSQAAQNEQLADHLAEIHRECSETTETQAPEPRLVRQEVLQILISEANAVKSLQDVPLASTQEVARWETILSELRSACAQIDDYLSYLRID